MQARKVAAEGGQLDCFAISMTADILLAAGRGVEN